MYKILERNELNNTVTKLVIEAPLVAKKAKPGQFIILRVNSDGERIPLTIADSNAIKGTVTIIFQIVGATTALLNEKQAGEYIEDFVGPLGEASKLDNLKKVCIVSGGVGSAIAFPIAKKLHELNAEVTTIVGFRTSDLVILENEFKEVSDRFILTTDDGTTGVKGNVTLPLKELLEKEKFDEVITIGPLVMMKYVCLLTKEYNIKTIVSMNPIMIDGTGMCGGCRLTVNGEVKFACVDGPDFDGHLVDFDEVISRNNTYKEFETKQRDLTCNLLRGKVHD